MWVTNAPVAKVGGTCNNNVANADHWQIFIHHENIWYYVIQTQLKTASDHSLRTQKFQKFPGEHAQTYIGGLSSPPLPLLCFFTLESPVTISMIRNSQGFFLHKLPGDLCIVLQ